MIIPKLDTDQLFFVFIIILGFLILLFGAGTLSVIFFDGRELGLRMLSIFAAMFSTFVGLGSGYLLGQTSSKRD